MQLLFVSKRGLDSTKQGAVYPEQFCQQHLYPMTNLINIGFSCVNMSCQIQITCISSIQNCPTGALMPFLPESVVTFLFTLLIGESLAVALMLLFQKQTLKTNATAKPGCLGTQLRVHVMVQEVPLLRLVATVAAFFFSCFFFSIGTLQSNPFPIFYLHWKSKGQDRAPKSCKLQGKHSRNVFEMGLTTQRMKGLSVSSALIVEQLSYYVFKLSSPFTHSLSSDNSKFWFT